MKLRTEDIFETLARLSQVPRRLRITKAQQGSMQRGARRARRRAKAAALAQAMVRQKNEPLVPRRAWRDIQQRERDAPLAELMKTMAPEHQRLFIKPKGRERLRQQFQGDETPVDDRKLLQKKGVKDQDGYLDALGPGAVLDPLPEIGK